MYLNNIQAARGQLDEVIALHLHSVLHNNHIMQLISVVEPGDTKKDAAKEAASKRLSLQQEVLQSTQEMCIQTAFATLKSTLFEAQDLFVRILRDQVDDITQKKLLGLKESNKRVTKPVVPPANYTPEPFAEAVSQYLGMLLYIIICFVLIYSSKFLLDAQLDVLSDKLEDKVFSTLMRRLWDAIVEVQKNLQITTNNKF